MRVAVWETEVRKTKDDEVDGRHDETDVVAIAIVAVDVSYCAFGPLLHLLAWKVASVAKLMLLRVGYCSLLP